MRDARPCKDMKSDLKTDLARIAAFFENAFEAVLPERERGPAGVEPYVGYSTPDSLVVRGRVLALKGDVEEERAGSRWENFQSMARLFDTDEMAGVRVVADGAEARSDEEGYFTLELPRGGTGDWTDIAVTLPEHGVEVTCPVRVTPLAARHGVISDIDDTLILTEAWSLRRNLWNSLTGSEGERHVFPDAVRLLERMDGAPVFYVSSSPWNLHGFLSRIFARAGLPRAPKFLRDLGLGSDQLITPVSGHHGHKGDSLDTIFAANPDLTFTLMGDTGQHDAQVYHAAIERHPDRIERVILRAAEPVLGEDDHAAIAALRATNAQIDVVRNYAELAD